MSMNKKEREQMELLKTKLALHFTAPVEKDLPPPSYGSDYKNLSCGWSYNSYNGRVYKTCSSSIFHGDGWEETRSQQPIWQYSTELLALRAIRNEIENTCAQKLRNIDIAIEACENSLQQPQPKMARTRGAVTRKDTE